MRPIENAKKALANVAMAAGAGLAAVEQIFLESAFGLDQAPESARESIIGFIVFFTVAAFTIVLWNGLVLWVERSRSMRSLLLGADQIEGLWVDVVYNSDTREILSGGLVNIYYNTGEIIIDGENFDATGHDNGSFKSTMTEYKSEEHNLIYEYRTNHDAHQLRDSDGSGLFSFHCSGRKPPRTFRGHFYVNGRNERYSVYGERVDDADADRLYGASLAERGAYLAKFVEKNRASFGVEKDKARETVSAE